MKNDGFTLVELMVVIVIVGILAAVSVGKYTDAMNKARASEAPMKLREIISAEAVYHAEFGEYIKMRYKDHDLFNEVLGVNISSQYFEYRMVVRGKEIRSFASAQSRRKRFVKPIGKGIYITLGVNNVRGPKNPQYDSKKYIPVWFN